MYSWVIYLRGRYDQRRGSPPSGAWLPHALPPWLPQTTLRHHAGVLAQGGDGEAHLWDPAMEAGGVLHHGPQGLSRGLLCQMKNYRPPVPAVARWLTFGRRGCCCVVCCSVSHRGCVFSQLPHLHACAWPSLLREQWRLLKWLWVWHRAVFLVLLVAAFKSPLPTPMTPQPLPAHAFSVNTLDVALLLVWSKVELVRRNVCLMSGVVKNKQPFGGQPCITGTSPGQPELGWTYELLCRKTTRRWPRFRIFAFAGCHKKRENVVGLRKRLGHLMWWGSLSVLNQDLVVNSSWNRSVVFTLNSSTEVPLLLGCGTDLLSLADVVETDFAVTVRELVV